MIDRINISETYSIWPLDAFEGIDDHATRQVISKSARDYPGTYRRMLLHRHVPVRDRIKGFVFIFDCHSVMRELAFACGTFGTPRILVPHESVLTEETKYYADIHTGVDWPTADLILGWGTLQGRIFLGWGASPERFMVVGAPSSIGMQIIDQRLTDETSSSCSNLIQSAARYCLPPSQ